MKAQTATPYARAYAIGLGALFALPVVFVAFKTIDLGSSAAEVADNTLAPLGRTLLLSVLVSGSAGVLGTLLAWITQRTNVWGANAWRVVLTLPLVLPSFVGAAAFLAALAPGGILEGALSPIGSDTPRQFRGLLPSWFVLTLFTYPYVLLSVSARLDALRPSLEESARLLGRSPRSTFVSVTLPQIRTSIATGALLVFLYSVSEFGAVQLLGYDTLTRVIYSSRLGDQATSFTAASMLIVVAVFVAFMERRTRETLRVDDRARSTGTKRLNLARWRLPVFAALTAVGFVGLVVPIASLSIWAARGLADGRVGFSEVTGPLVGTAIVGLITAVIAVAAVLPMAELTVRHRSRTGDIASVAVVAGFAVPGLVIALSFVFWFIRVPWLYQTFPLLILAYVIHFGSQALGAAETAVQAVPDNIRSSSRLLSPSAWHRRRVAQWPLMRPGLTSGAGLVLLATLKELPATLLLAPIGFNTLATRVWSNYEEGFLAAVGLNALALVFLSAALTWFLVLRAPRQLT